MWDKAAGWLGNFPEAVLTGLDSGGYPVSVRVDTQGYDAVTGELPATLPETLGAVEGPANLLCHYHDEKMWNIKAIQIKGRLEKRGDAWVFVSTKFNPPSRTGLFGFMRSLHVSAQKYLDKRGLERPAVNWAAIKEIKRRVSNQGPTGLP